MKLGIDFGTTTCTIGRLRLDGEQTVMEPIPSIAAWSNGTLVFGNEARKLIRSQRTDIYPIRDLKLMLGGEERIAVGRGTIDPEDVAAELLRFLVQRVGGGEVDSAVIGTPVRVSMGQRQSTRRAAAKAGISDVSFVYEPTAALIGAQRFASADARGMTLVIDWGGGTLDIAAIRTDGTRYEEIAVGGDIKALGGTKIDEEITSRLLQRDHDLRVKVAMVPEGMQRLKDEVEELKLLILELLDGPDAPAEQISPLWLPRTVISLEPQLVYTVLAEFAERAAIMIGSKLSAAGIDSQEITDVLFAGGVSQAPEIQKRVMRDYPNARQRSTVAGTSVALRPQELTGAGCVQITARQVLPELARGFGVRQSDGSVCVLLPAGFPIAMNTFRKADFLVVDLDANEAIFDLGLMNSAPGSIALSEAADSFESLMQLFVPAGVQPPRTREPEPERVVLCVGIDRDLAVTISASAEMARSTVTTHQSGIPLILRFR
jgi:molecular chaperone DnaK (HSP70)